MKLFKCLIMAAYIFYFGVVVLIHMELSASNSMLTYLETTPSKSNIFCQQNKSMMVLSNNFTINDSPQSIHDFYICGWNNNSILLSNNKYNITYTLSSLNYATINHLTPINNSTNKLSLQLNSFSISTIGQITLYSISTSANNITIFINLSNCHNGYYQNYNHITSSFNCSLCDNNTYSMDRNKCKQCNEGMICLNGNNIYIKKHYYGININGTIYTAYCLSNYCCNDINGCYILNNTTHSNNNMCVKNRNNSVALCGLCNNQFCETMNSMNGICVKCNDQNDSIKYIFFLLYLIICIIVVWILYNISYYIETQTQDPGSSSITNEFVICIWYNLLPFYQTLLYLHAYEFELQSLQFLSYIANSNLFLFNISLGVNATSREKLILLLMPVFMFIIAIFKLYIVLKIKYKNKMNENSNNALKCTIWYIITLIYLHTFSIFMKLSHCVNIQPFGKRMSWNGNIECYDAQQIMSIIIAIFGLIIFPICLCFYFRKKK
eukprot:166220_1